MDRLQSSSDSLLGRSRNGISFDYVSVTFSSLLSLPFPNILLFKFFRHSFGEKFSKEKWLKEINGQREILHLYGGVKYEDVRGMRAPFLQPGGNNQYEMLYEANFTYDSSLPVSENNPPYWPYTFDYAISHNCAIPPCPTRSFPGMCSFLICCHFLQFFYLFCRSL